MELKKIVALVLIFLMTFSGFVLMPHESQGMILDPQSCIVSNSTSDGSITKSGAAYGVWDTTTVDSVGSSMTLINFDDGMTPYLSRAYVSFDTSGIPDSSLIFDLKMQLYVEFCDAYSELVIYGESTSYGALDSSDWDYGAEIASFVVTSTGFINVSLPTALINSLGVVDFCIRLNDESSPPPSDEVRFSSSDAGDPYEPRLYYRTTDDPVITYGLDDGTAESITVTPIFADHNYTHRTATIEFDTVSGVDELTIQTKNWGVHSFSPYSQDWEIDVTVPADPEDPEINTLHIYDVHENCTYRIYYFVPVEMASNIYMAMYQSDTGVGLPFETYRVAVSEGAAFNSSDCWNVTSAAFDLIYGVTYTIGVLDYFGNVIANSTITPDSLFEYVTISIDVNSFKVFNQQDDFARIRIYYEGAGAPIEYFLAPWEPVERFLRDGNYTVTVTWYDNDTAGDSVYFEIAVDGAEFLMLEGMTISRVISDVAGVRAVQEVITRMLTPDVVFIGEDLPMVPNDAYDPGIELVHPWSIVHGYANGIEFTNETLFYYTYYTSRKFYEVTLNLTNDDGENWTNVTWFIGFPENRSIDYSSVRVYDLNNECYLTAGLHYDMTLTGIRMKWTYFNDTLSRAVLISMYDANASSGGGLAIATATDYAPSQYDGENYYLATARWTNSFSYAYDGQVSIWLKFDEAADIDPNSIIVYDRNTGRELLPDEYAVSGSIIVVGSIEAEIGTVYAFDVYFKLDLSETDSLSMTSPFLGVPLWLWFLGAACVGILALWTMNGRTVRGRKLKLNKEAGAFIVVIVSIFFILWYFMQAGML